MRNTYIISKTLRTFFIASVLSSIVTQLNTLVDGIVVSHAVDEDAISAVNMCTPVLSIVMIIASMIYSGAGILMGKAIGNQKYDSANRIYTVSIVSVVFINLVIAIVCCCCVDLIADALTTEERLLPLLKSYLPISFFGSLFVVFQMTMAQFIRVSGRPALVTKCMVVESLGNILLDFLFVVHFEWGMYGAAAASALAVILSTFVFVPYLRSDEKPFSFVKVSLWRFFCVLGRESVRGFPVALGSVVMAAMMLALNALILKAKGADGMFVFSVCMQVLMLSMLLLGGAGQVITGIGGVLLGEYDYEALRKVLTIVFKLIVKVMSFCTVVIYFFPEMLAQLFGAKGHLLQESVTPLRQFIFVLLPLGIIVPLSNVFVLINRNFLASFINIGMLVCLVPLVFLATMFFPDHIWSSMSVAMWIVLLVSMALVYVISRKHKGLHWLFLIPQVDKDNTISLSVKYNRNDAISKVEKITETLKSRNIDCYDSVKHCIEEVLVNEAENGIAAKRRGEFDVFSTLNDGKFTIILKSVGSPYNPFKSEGQADLDAPSLDIVKGYSTETNYKYMNGVNCLYINIDTKKVESHA